MYTCCPLQNNLNIIYHVAIIEDSNVGSASTSIGLGNKFPRNKNSTNQRAELIVVIHVLTISLINLRTIVLIIPLFSRYFRGLKKLRNSSDGHMPGPQKMY